MKKQANSKNILTCIDTMTFFKCKTNYKHSDLPLNIIGIDTLSKVTPDNKAFCIECYKNTSHYTDFQIQPTLKSLNNQLQDIGTESNDQFKVIQENIQELATKFENLKCEQYNKISEKLLNYSQDLEKKLKELKGKLPQMYQNLIINLLNAKNIQGFQTSIHILFKNTEICYNEEKQWQDLKWKKLSRQEKEINFVAENILNKFQKSYDQIIDAINLLNDEMTLPLQEIFNNTKSLTLEEFKLWNYDKIVACENEMIDNCKNNCSVRITQVSKEDFIAGEIGPGNYVTYYKTGYAIGTNWQNAKGETMKGCKKCDETIRKYNEQIFAKRKTLEYY